MRESLADIRIEKAKSAAAAKATTPTPTPSPFDEIATVSADEAMTALRTKAMAAIPVLDESFIRQLYIAVAGTWDSKRLYEGTLEEIFAIVHRNLVRLQGEVGFTTFTVATYKDDRCAQVLAAFSLRTSSFQPIRLWRSEEKVFACGNAAFHE